MKRKIIIKITPSCINCGVQCTCGTDMHFCGLRFRNWQPNDEVMKMVNKKLNIRKG